MPEFYVLVRHAPTQEERASLRAVGCTIVPIPPEVAPTSEPTAGYAVRVPAESEADAVDRVVAAGIDDATIWRNFPLAALP